MTYAIETTGLGKRYGDTVALEGVDLKIERGTVFGLLGPNGAGKTTTIRILATLARPTAGRASVLGHDVVEEAAAVRRKVSLTGQYASIDEDLTGRENLVLVGRLLGLSWRGAKQRADELLEAFELSDAAARQVRTYSGGMRRRMDIAASLVVTPEVLFLDEPTTGLDPRSRNQVWDMVRRIARSGTTVLLTTQYLEEADRLADRLAVIDDGRLIAEGTSRELKASVGANALRIHVTHAADRDAAMRLVAAAVPETPRPGDDPHALTVTLPDKTHATRLLDALADAGIDVSEFAMGDPTLDEVFFALTGRTATDAETETATTEGAPKAEVTA